MRLPSATALTLLLSLTTTTFTSASAEPFYSDALEARDAYAYADSYGYDLYARDAYAEPSYEDELFARDADASLENDLYALYHAVLQARDAEPSPLKIGKLLKGAAKFAAKTLSPIKREVGED